MRRPSPIYIGTLLLLAATVAVAIAARGAGTTGGANRTASVHDDTAGGAAALRRYVTAMGAQTTVIEGDSFAIPPGTSALFILGTSEVITPADAQVVKAFVDGGGLLVLATDVGLFERPLLDQFHVRTGGIALSGTHALANAAFADPPARSLAIDRGVTLTAAAGQVVLATDGKGQLVVAGTSGRGLFHVIGSLAPFLTASIGIEDNGAFALGLVRLALAGGVVAFDEYHHGFHPSSDVLVLLERTAPGRALVFATAMTLLYLALSGRRLGPPVPMETRPSRSSLEYIRGFAGLVRRSGRGEIARRRLRGDLRRALARELGLDPEVPFDRVVTALAVADPARAAEARAIDDALTQRLREDQLLRTVRQIDRIVAGRTTSETRPS
jgi:hypothetical protein